MKPIILAVLACTTTLSAQKLEFEVASIRPSNPDSQGSVGLHIDGAQIRISSLPLRDYIAMAYRLKVYQISGPSWLNSARFEISANLPPGAPPSKIPEMLQTLLADRFELQHHMEKKDLPLYAIVVDKAGLKMEPIATDETAPRKSVDVSAEGSAAGVAANLGNGSSYTLANNKFAAKKLTMIQFAASIERFLDRPVADLTALPYTYDFSLDLSEEDYRGMLIHAAVNAGVVLPPQALKAMDGASLGSLFSALQKLGLKMDARKAPLELVVVDSVRKSPTSN